MTSSLQDKNSWGILHLEPPSEVGGSSPKQTRGNRKYLVGKTSPTPDIFFKFRQSTFLSMQFCLIEPITFFALQICFY